MRNLLYCVVTAVACIGSVTIAAADGGTFTRGCAARDLQIMMMLDHRGITPQEFADVMRTVTHARVMCFDGQVMDALAVYDSLADSIRSDWALSGHGQ